jgi:hypothetical protein
MPFYEGRFRLSYGAVGERRVCGSGAQLALQPSAQGVASTWL